MVKARRQKTGDDGFALMTVVFGMLAVTVVLIGTVTYVVNSMPISKRGQDSSGALQAAQAGIDDYLARLVTCDAYWSTAATCRSGSTNKAFTPDAIAGSGRGVIGADRTSTATGWATIPFSGTGVAQYHVDEIATPATGSATIRIRSTGRVQPAKAGDPAVKRSLVVDIGRQSLLDYIYYTDKESSDPAGITARYPARKIAIDPTQNNGYYALEYAGVSTSEAAKCDNYWYGATSSSARRNSNYNETYKAYRTDGSTANATTARSCDIQFAPIDVIDGKLHTNDAILLNNPLFKGETTTSWPATSTPAPSAAAWYRLVSGGSAPQAGSALPKYAAPVTLPDSNTSIKDSTDPTRGGQDGCPYTGPTRIVLKNNGTMDVTSPLTTKTNAGCTTGSTTAPGLATTQNVPLPKNGVIYVDGSTASCSGKPTAFPLKSNDVTPYTCNAGDVFLEGTLKGRLTIASRGDIITTEDITYAGTGSDVLGLVAEGNVEVYHPVSCTTVPAAGYSCNSFSNIDVGISDITVSGAILSTQHSFTVQNYDVGAKLGKLTVIGGIYQKFRGAVGTGGGTGTGYAKNYSYDKRLKTLPPPSFLNPVAAPWVAGGSAEVSSAVRCPASGTLPAACLPR